MGETIEGRWGRRGAPARPGSPVRWRAAARPVAGSAAGRRGFRPTLARALGLAAAGLAVLLFALLHLLVTRLNPVTDTISDYALSPFGWVFDGGAVVLAAGSVVLLGPLSRHPRSVSRMRGAGWPRATTAARGCFGCWCGGLLVLTVFPRDPVGAPVSLTGVIHQWASVAALLGLPLGALATALRHRDVRASRIVGVTAVACLAALVPFTIAYLAGSPLRPYVGLLERLVALAEIVLLVLLGTVLAGGVRSSGAAVLSGAARRAREWTRLARGGRPRPSGPARSGGSRRRINRPGTARPR